MSNLLPGKASPCSWNFFAIFLLSFCGLQASTPCFSDQFSCQNSGLELCLNLTKKCDGTRHCDRAADELVSECDQCVHPDRFRCLINGQEACLSKAEYQCDGTYHCDDFSDELPSVCDNCSRPGFFLCRDGSMCVMDKHLCDGASRCTDGSDESDSWAKCTVCALNDSVPCPGFPGICARVCNGKVECPDRWDELLSTCQAYGVPCTEKEGLYPCKDDSRCLSRSQLCDAGKDCDSGEDEEASKCKTECNSHREKDFPLHACDGDSCIWRYQKCSARTKPLCQDGSDMDPSVCEGRCYTFFPGMEDPHYLPCPGPNPTKCILRTSICDGRGDCPWATDEHNCPWYTKLTFGHTFLICLGIVIISWTLYYTLTIWSQSVSMSRIKSASLVIHPTSESSSVFAQSSIPSFLLHPAFHDMDGQQWSWEDIGRQLRIEVLFFNREPQFLFSFLSHVEAQDAHPTNIHRAFNGLFDYLETKTWNRVAVAISIRQSIGYHRLAHMALKGPPNILERSFYDFGQWVEGHKDKSKVFSIILAVLNTSVTTFSPYILFLDYVKDLVLFLILDGTVRRLKLACETAFGSSCLAATPIEEYLLFGLLATLCVSIILTSVNSFHRRHHFFATNFFLDIFLFVISPLLPALFHIHVALLKNDLRKNKKRMSNKEYQKEQENIANLVEVMQQSKSIEVGFEAIMQIVLLLGLATFVFISFKAPSGQSYSYFYGVARLVLKGNKQLFVGSIFVSFLGPCFFYVNWVSHLKHNSMSLTRKLVTLLKNLFFLLARVGFIVSAIFIPVISQWSIYVANKGVDASKELDFVPFIIEFNKNYFSNWLQSLSANVEMNFRFFLLFLFVHIMVMSSYAIFRSGKFGTSLMTERWLHLVTSVWLPLPYLSRKGVDRGEEENELWFLIVLHTIENFGILLISRWVYIPQYPLWLFVVHLSLVSVNLLAMLSSATAKWFRRRRSLYLVILFTLNILAVIGSLAFTQKIQLGLFVIDISLVVANIIAIFLSIVFAQYLDLYADLPHDVPSMPSFGPEVSLFTFYSFFLLSYDCLLMRFCGPMTI